MEFRAKFHRFLCTASLLACQAATACETGYQPLGDRCISQRMADFITCVERTGGNRESVAEEIRTRTPANSSLRRPEEVVIASNVTKFFAGAMRECAKLLQDPGDAPVDLSNNLLELRGLVLGMSISSFRAAFARHAPLVDSRWRTEPNGNSVYVYATYFAGIPSTVSHTFRDGRLISSIVSFRGSLIHRTIGGMVDEDFAEINQDRVKREEFSAACGNDVGDSPIWRIMVSRFPATPTAIFDRRWDESDSTKDSFCPKHYTDPQCSSRKLSYHRKYLFTEKDTKAELEEVFDVWEMNRPTSFGAASPNRILYRSGDCKVTVAFRRSQ